MNSDMVRGMAIGILVGGLIGTAVGMLYAPHSGRITRGLIAERMNEARNEAERIVDEARFRAQHMLREAKSRVRK